MHLRQSTDSYPRYGYIFDLCPSWRFQTLIPRMVKWKWEDNVFRRSLFRSRILFWIWRRSRRPIIQVFWWTLLYYSFFTVPYWRVSIQPRWYLHNRNIWREIQYIPDWVGLLEKLLSGLWLWAGKSRTGSTYIFRRNNRDGDKALGENYSNCGPYIDCTDIIVPLFKKQEEKVWTN